MLNKVILMGRLSKDVDLRYSAGSGAAVARYSLAVDRPKYKDKDKETDFINILCFGKTAEFASQYLKKGSLIIIEGRIQMNKWTDNEGKNRTSYDVVAESHQFVPGSKKNDGAVANNATTETNANNATVGDFELLNDVDEKDLPF